MNNNIKIVKNAIWNSFGVSIYFVCQWLITILVVRQFNGFVEAGNLSLAMNISNIFFCIASYNMRAFQVSDIKPEYSDNIYITSRFITCFISILICIFFVIFAGYSKIQCLVIIFYMLYRCNEAFVDVLYGINQKIWKMEYIGISFIMRGITMLLTFILLSSFFKNLLLSIFGMFIITLLLIIIYDIPKITKLTKLISLNIIKIIELLKKCFPLMLVVLINTMIPAYVRFSIENKYGIEALGIYSSVIAPTIIIQLLAFLIFTPLIGIFAEYLKEKNIKKFIKLYYLCIIIIVCITFILYILALLYGEFGLKILFGETIVLFKYLLPDAVIVAGVTALMLYMNIIFSTIKDIKGILYGNIFGLIICIIAINYLLNKYELSGANYIIIFSLSAALIYLNIRFFWYIKYRMIKREFI